MRYYSPEDTLEYVVSWPFEQQYRSSKRQRGAVRISHWHESHDQRRGNDLQPLWTDRRRGWIHRPRL